MLHTRTRTHTCAHTHTHTHSPSDLNVPPEKTADSAYDIELPVLHWRIPEDVGLHVQVKTFVMEKKLLWRFCHFYFCTFLYTPHREYTHTSVCMHYSPVSVQSNRLIHTPVSACITHLCQFNQTGWYTHQCLRALLTCVSSIRDRLNSGAIACYVTLYVSWILMMFVK